MEKHCPDCGNTHINGACGDEHNEVTMENTLNYIVNILAAPMWALNNKINMDTLDCIMQQISAENINLTNFNGWRKDNGERR